MQKPLKRKFLAVRGYEVAIVYRSDCVLVGISKHSFIIDQEKVSYKLGLFLEYRIKKAYTMMINAAEKVERNKQ